MPKKSLTKLVGGRILGRSEDSSTIIKLVLLSVASECKSDEPFTRGESNVRYSTGIILFSF
jgi:hypothetical protein